MLKLGFELEAFILKDGLPTLVPTSLPMDECGWLVEIRSDPHTSVRKAIALLNVERAIVEERTQKFPELTLAFLPTFDVPRDVKVKALRRTGKDILRYRNLYGHENHRTKLSTASLHVSFTNEQTFFYTDMKGVNKEHKYPGFIDHAKIIMAFDKAFKDEIRAAGRNPGFYETKPDGRIEYRSLPNNVDLQKLQDTLSSILREL